MFVLEVFISLLAYVVTAVVLAIAVTFFGVIGLVAWLDWRADRAFEEELKKMPKWERKL